ncbi:hypothetical protein J8273_1938 [Carpediemonas membranifera]|uniref:RRM domain-containing protein n=1 Tax=Carpediemonas membranifera TaxID=201153 RepID=A0A8J6C0S8_9EUKA|nr:hypothetical protein J8273_1938 [Carpediemonas membranifera]|eukprot:KAG9396891.1 hypothetical protein J8273_1938 [Carpediemonas membranifera]
MNNLASEPRRTSTGRRIDPGIVQINSMSDRMNHEQLRSLLAGAMDALFKEHMLNSNVPAAGIGRIFLIPKPGNGPIGYVEFLDKRYAYRLAQCLNDGSTVRAAGRRVAKIHWMLQYLSKVTWDDLTRQNKFNKAVRDKRTDLELTKLRKEDEKTMASMETAKKVRSMKQRKGGKWVDKKGKNKVVKRAGQKKSMSNVAMSKLL